MEAAFKANVFEETYFTRKQIWVDFRWFEVFLLGRAPRKTWKMGYGLGFIGVIAHLLNIDPNFQRDIQVGCFSKLSFSIRPIPSLEGMDLHKKPTFTPKLFSRELGGWGWLLRLLRVCGWWFQIVFIFTPILEMIQFGQYFSNGVKPPTR